MSPRAANRILIAPLNWGLGHATRCVPLIRSLCRLGLEPVLASDGQALELLRAEFPALPSEELPSYRIRYGSGNMIWNMGWQLPRIAWTCRQEHAVLRRLVRRYEPLAVISDNRFGCFHTGVPSVFLTHQLNIRAPYAWLTDRVNRINHYFLSRYAECWVPDRPGPENLSGALSHPSPLPQRTYFIGKLTRFRPLTTDLTYDIVILLSGPEPQRTYFEEKLWQQVRQLSGRVLMIGGKITGGKKDLMNGTVHYVPFMGSEQLNETLAATRLVICRPGYSTLMDLSVLGKRALLVPTPGQTEQEYLAQRLHQAGWCYRQAQSELNLSIDIPKAMTFQGLSAQPVNDLVPFLKSWLDRIGC